MSIKPIIDLYKLGFKYLKNLILKIDLKFKIKNLKFPGLLLLLTAILSFLNYQPGTWLTGWDNLHPEFYPSLNLRRALFTVWQEYQSLGLLGGMGHAADLPRQLVLYLFYPAFPASFIRYLWTFLMLALGPLGVYFSLRDHFLHSATPLSKLNLFRKLKTKVLKTPLVFDQRTRSYAAFLGGLYYLLNLGTVQSFFTPFETFTTYHGFFPWIIYTLLSYFKTPNRRNLLIFAATSFLAAPSFYVQTLFVTLCLSLLPLFIEHLTKKEGSDPSRKGRTLLGSSLTLFITQAFWLLPVIFFVLTNGDVGTKSHINLISSLETYYRNLEFGNLANLALLKGFWFNYIDLTNPTTFGFLMTSWRDHLSDPIISIIGYFFFTVIIAGIYYAVKRNLYMGRGLFGILGICYFFLNGGGLLLNNKIPLIGELFRSPFTKFDTPLTFVYAIFFAVGCILLLDLFSLLHTHLTYSLTLFTVSFLLILFTAPAFQGQLISPSMRQNIPQEYFQAMAFFQDQDSSTRIANFPQHTHWGWNFYNWKSPNPTGGYRGSGFLWYGIKQPLMDRAFDVWESSSEKSFEKIQAALYSGDQDKFISLLQEYDVTWVLIDKYIYTPNQPTDLYTDELEKILKSSPDFSLAKNFNDKILIYQAKPDPALQGKTKPGFLSTDPLPQKIPLLDLSLRPQIDWKIENNQITLPTIIQQGQALLEIPSYTDTENIVATQIDYKKNQDQLILRFTPLLPSFSSQATPAKSSTVTLPIPTSQNSFILKINEQYFTLLTPAEVTSQSDFTPLAATHLPTKQQMQISLFSGTSSSPINITSLFEAATPYQCYTNKQDKEIEKVVLNNSISLFGTDAVGCLSTRIPAQESLISLSFEYSSSTNTQANINITDSALNADSPRTTPLKTSATPTKQTLYYTTNIANPQINLILEANETTSLQEVSYKNITLNSYPPITNQSFTLPHIPGFSLTAKPTTIALPIIDSPLTNIQTPASNSLASEARNCNQFKDKLFTKDVVNDSIIYTAQDATSCDYLNLPSLPHSTNYLLAIKAANIKGLPATVCLENHTTRRCDVFERLTVSSPAVTDHSSVSSPAGSPDSIGRSPGAETWFTILNPISNPSEPSGYTLHLNTQSFGNRVAQNAISNILITPIPLNFLQNITVDHSPAGSRSKAEDSPGVGSITQSTHPAPFLYTVDLSSASTLNLYQTYSPYWVALNINKSEQNTPLWQIILKLPYLYLTSQKLTNTQTNWHNSWQLDPSQAGSSSIIIFYAPQYLQFAGFALLLLLPILLKLHKK